MTSVNVKDLNRMIETRKLDRNVAFNRIYDMCQQRIISHAKKDMLRMVFEMPEFILGIPPFNLNDALTHVIDRLKNNGFLVMYFFPKLLYISWDMDEITGKKSVQPVAMLPGNRGQVPLQIAAADGKIQSIPEIHATPTRLPPPPQQMRHTAPLTAPRTAPHTAPLIAPPYLQPHMPPLDLPMPIASSRKQLQKQQSQASSASVQLQNQQQPTDQTRFFKSISDYKPSGKFVLDLN